MGWVAFAVTAALLVYGSWRVWRDWISASRDVEETIVSVLGDKQPRTYLVSGSATMRRIGLALEDLAQRQKNLNARLQESEFGLQSIVAALPDALAVVDEQRRLRLTNPAFRETFALSSLTNGTTLLEVVRDASVEELLGETLKHGEMRRGTIARPRGDGPQHLEVIAEPIRNREEKLTGAVVLFHDVTSHRQTETLRRDFVANVSHELRTPLSILRGYLETLLENPKQPPAELLRILEVMERHSNRLNLLVDDVLSLARLEDASAALRLTKVRPAQFLREMLRDWEKKIAAKNLSVTLEAADDLPTLVGDETRLQELIYNLLDNAVKYSRAGDQLFVRAKQEGERLCLTVTDHGPGISARDLPRIFERFYRGDKSRGSEIGGTGLGLAIVKHIVQLHGGSVEAESELNRGTTVRVRLPLGAQPADVSKS